MDSLNYAQHIAIVEEKLHKSSDSYSDFHLLTQLIDYYTFTDSKKARFFLEEQRFIIENTLDERLQIRYLITAGFVENQHYNYFLSESYYSQAIRLIEDSEDIDLKIEVYLDYTATCQNAEKTEQAEIYLRKTMRLLEAFPNPVLEARLITRQGFYNLQISNFPKAIYLLLEAEKQFSNYEDELQFKDYYFLTLIFSGLGRIYEVTNDTENSIKNYAQAVALCEATGIKTRLSFHYRNLGNAYMSISDANSAENYYRNAINTLDDISQNARAGAFANLGKCLFNKGEYSQANDLYKKARLLYKKMPESDALNSSVIETFMAELAMAMEKPKKALKHLTAALDFAQQIENFNQLANVCKEIASYYSTIGDYKKAYEYQLYFEQMTDKNNAQLRSQQVIELQIQYESEKTEQEANMLRLKATQLQHKALRAQMNPHFMFNVLNAIQLFMNQGNVDEANTYLSRFADLMRDSLNYSDLEVISLEEEIDFLSNYLLLNQKMRFDGKMKYDILVDDDVETDIMGVPSMIIQPYVENALEHGIKSLKNGQIDIVFMMYDDNNLLCIIQDNGVGRVRAALIKEENRQLQAKTKHRSMGTSITNDRLKIIHAEREIENFIQIIDLQDENGIPNGTRVEVIIPILELKKSWEEEGEEN